MTIAGLVLAGGLSRRMGRDKASIVLGGETLAGRGLRRLRSQVDLIALNANGADGSFADLGVPVLRDHHASFQGPLAGIAAGLAWARVAGAARLATVPVDSPFVPEDFVARLAAAAPADRIAVARTASGRHPVAALIPTALAADLERWLAANETRRVNAWLGTHPIVEVDFPPLVIEGEDIDPFLNLNTPDDLAAAERLAAAAR